MAKTMEVFVTDKWVELPRGKELFDDAVKAELPIRVVHTTPKGVSTKVIRNAKKAPKEEQESVVAWAEKSPEDNQFFGAMVASS